MNTTISRRTVLQLMAGTGASLVLGSFTSAACASQTQQKVKGTELNAFLTINPDGSIIFTSPKPDMGQGARTTLAMLVAEELDADWTTIKVVQAEGNSSKYGGQGVGGSSTVRGSNQNMRKIGATARAMLVAAAAQKWSVDAGTLKTSKGVVTSTDGKKATYGELVAIAKTLSVPTGVPLKDKSQFTIIGKSTSRVDNTDVVTGKAMFGLDVKVPGMVFAVINRPPTFGASPQKVDDSATRKIAGVLDVFPMSSGVAVIATNTWAAIKGRAALKIDWSVPHPEVSTASLREALKGAISEHNDMPSGKVITAEFELPYLAHGTMETLNAVADVRADGVDVWSGSQSPDSAQAMIARATGVPKEKVTMHTMLLGGGFGRKFSNEWIGEAVELSMKVKKPVKLLWTRECDIQHDLYRPMSHHALKAAVDASGNPIGWSHQYLQAPGRGGNYSGNTYLPYNLPNAAMKSGGVGTPVPTGAWRSVEHSQICVVNECFVDELAHAAGKDPYEFRLEHANSDRLRAVLKSVAKKAGWGTPTPNGVGRGIACFEGYGSCVAHVVEVSVANGMIKVLKMTAVVDPGTTVNPRGVEAQIQGAFIDGLSTALKAAITIEKGGAKQDNWDGYEWGRMSDAPETHVYVEESGAGFGGMGEVGYPSSPAAIANALFAATGKRARKFPIVLEELI